MLPPGTPLEVLIVSTGGVSQDIVSPGGITVYVLVSVVTLEEILVIGGRVTVVAMQSGQGYEPVKVNVP